MMILQRDGEADEDSQWPTEVDPATGLEQAEVSQA
jgi:hypothetical protein